MKWWDLEPGKPNLYVDHSRVRSIDLLPDTKYMRWWQGENIFPPFSIIDVPTGHSLNFDLLAQNQNLIAETPMVRISYCGQVNFDPYDVHQQNKMVEDIQSHKFQHSVLVGRLFFDPLAWTLGKEMVSRVTQNLGFEGFNGIDINGIDNYHDNRELPGVKKVLTTIYDEYISGLPIKAVSLFIASLVPFDSSFMPHRVGRKIIPGLYPNSKIGAILIEFQIGKDESDEGVIRSL